MNDLAKMVADANGRIVKNARLPNYTHAYPIGEESDHAFDGEGCWCEPNHIYNNDETILVHKRTRAD